MANDKRIDRIDEVLAALAPPADWEPDTAYARSRFHARAAAERTTRPRLWIAVATACAVAAIVVSLPPTRALAQHLWRWMTVGSVEVVQVDFSKIPDQAKSLTLRSMSGPVTSRVVAGPAEAAAAAGFSPRLPAPGMLSSPSRLSVLGPMTFATTIRAADLELALRHANVHDTRVPQGWDGARLILQIGGAVTAEWEGTTLMQAPPATLVTPDNFDLGAFAVAVLRAAGMDSTAARMYGDRLARSPSLLLGMSSEDPVRVREVALASGTGTLIEDLGEDAGTERTTVIWNTPDRVYILSTAHGAELALRIANEVR